LFFMSARGGFEGKMEMGEKWGLGILWGGDWKKNKKKGEWGKNCTCRPLGAPEHGHQAKTVSAGGGELIWTD